MGAPSINIAFIEKSASAIQRGERGIVALILKEKAVEKADFTVYSVTDIPDWLSDGNKAQLEMALKGYQNAPRKVLVHVMEGAGTPTGTEGAVAQEGVEKTAAGEAADGYKEALGHLRALKWDYLAIPSVEADGKTEMVASWIKSQRTVDKKTFKAVLPNSPSDCEGVVNVTNGCTKGDAHYTAADMCARVAGIICGTPITISCTYAPLPEMTGCDDMGKDEVDKAVDAGEFVFIWDGEKAKVCRGVNSFVTTTDKKGDSFKKIKIIDAMDMIQDDINITIQDSYTGKYANDYDNKCVLITAINGYFSGLVREGVLSSGTCQIDIEAQREYLLKKGGLLVVNGEEKRVEECTDDEIKVANTGSFVFLKAAVSINDAMEDFNLDIYIG